MLEALTSGDTNFPSVGIAGTGRMGTAIVLRLLELGFEVHVNNRTADRSKPLLDAGAHWATTPADLARSADILLTVLTDGAAARQVTLGAGGLMDGAEPKRSVVVDVSTARPRDKAAIAEGCRIRGIPFLDAPVAGTVDAARSGALLVMAGGGEEAFSLASPVLTALGESVFHVGEAGDGSRMKLVVNTLLGVSTLALAESLRLADVFGLDLVQAHEVLSSSPSSSRLVVHKGTAMVHGDFEAKAATQILVKDMALALEAMADTGATAPGIQAAHLAFATASALGMADLDFASVYEALRRLGRSEACDG